MLPSRLMAVIERKRVTREQQPERAVFVASDGRRARLVRRAAFVTAFIAGLWLLSLGVGMLGFGSLPGVSAVKEQFDKVAGGPDAPRAEPSKRISTPTSRVSAQVEGRRVVTPTPTTRSVRSPRRAKVRPVASRPTPRPVQATTPQPVAAQTPVNPAARQRGWARDGSTAPPGQTRQAVPPPPPGTRGERRGQDPTAPPPVPPGQVKKAQEPPPPPTPPKKG